MFNGGELTQLPIPTVALTSSASPVIFGQPVTFTAKIQPFGNTNTPTGFVGFNFLQAEESDANGSGVGMGPWTTVPVDGTGTATFTTSSLVALQTPVVAHYLGDANNSAATQSMTQTVQDFQTVTTLTASQNPAPYGTPVVFTATALDSNGKPFQGSITMGMGNVQYVAVTLDANGQATWTNGQGGPLLPVGTDTLFAKFGGGTGYLASSATLAMTFTPLGTTPAPTFNPPAGTYSSGQSVVLSDSSSTAAIYFTTDGSTPVAGASQQFVQGMTLSVASSETIQAIAVAPGYSSSNVVSASYAINLQPPGFTSGPGATMSITVTRGATSGNTGTVSVVGTNGFSGNVTLSCGVTTAMTGVNDMPACNLSPGSLTISGTAAQVSKLTITTTAATSADNRQKTLLRSLPGTTALALVLCLGLFRPQRKWLAVLGLFVLFAGMGILACGGGGGGGNGGVGNASSGTTSGAYTVTVVGSSGGTSATVGNVALTVQ